MRDYQISAHDLITSPAFIEHYNHQRYHESLANVTPANTRFGKIPTVIKQREGIKPQTIEHRLLQHRKLAA